jgi:hypothetical protein
MLRKIQTLFMRLVQLVEDHPAPLRRYFQLYFAILAVRLCLEFFSSHRLFQLADILHISLWFIFIVLAFLLQLHLFSGERIAKVTKLVVVGFTIALTAPIIDLVFNGGVGAKMNYLAINDWRDILPAYFTLGGPSLSRGATLGIRIEIVLLVIASFNYVRSKRGSILWGLAAAVSIYTVLFLSGMVPYYLGQIVTALHLSYGPDDQSTLLLLFMLDLALLAGALVCHAPRKVWRIVKAMPWGALGIAVGHLCIGAGLARQAYPDNWQLTPTTLFWFPLFVALMLALGAFIALQRLPVEGPGDPWRVPSGKYFLAALSIAIGLAVSQWAAFVVAVIWGILLLLNEPPLNLRRAPLLRNLLEAMAVTAVALLGFAAFGGPMVGFPTEWLIPLIAAQAIGALFTDVGRPGDDAIGWYGRWLSGFQRLFRQAAIVLLVGAAAVMAWVLGLGTVEAVLVGASALAAGVLIGLYPSRVQWALVVLWPVYAVLACSIF